MASTVVLESVVVHSVEDFPLSKLPRAHTRDSSRAEQDLVGLSQEMESESTLRQRPTQGQSASTPNQGDSPTGSAGPLAPTSSEGSQQTLGISMHKPDI
jgi:hypothetical protein